MKKYYLNDGENQSGPFDYYELKQKQINKDTPVWFEGLNNWTIAGELDELKDILKPIPPQFKATSVTPPPVQQPLPETKKGSMLLWVFVSMMFVIIALMAFFILRQNTKEAKPEAPVTTDIIKTQAPLDTSVAFALAKKTNDSFAFAEKEKKSKNEVLIKKFKNLRNNWYAYITTYIDSKNVLAFGGFKEVVLAIDNKTPYELDYVEVQIHYFKANHDLFKTEIMTLTDVEPNKGNAWKAPDSERGNYITTEITKIKANKFSFCYDKLAERNMASDTAAITGVSGNPLDPWKCN